MPYSNIVMGTMRMKNNNKKSKQSLKHTEMMMLLFFFIAFIFSVFQLSILGTFHADHHDHQQVDHRDGRRGQEQTERHQEIIAPYKSSSTTINNKNNSNNNNKKKKKKKTFLLYYSHSGFSNQLLSIERAARFAFATQRTLVLPPILPHVTSSSSTFASDHHKFSSFEPRTAGSKCNVASQYEDFVNFYIPQDIKKAQDHNIPFPSFKEIFDFDDLSQKIGVEFMDMREFVTQYPNYTNHPRNNNNNNNSNKVWCSGPMEEMKIKFVRNCGPNSTFDELVSFFNKHCGHEEDDNSNDNAAVAVLGSAFVMPQPILDNSTYLNRELQTVFSQSFGNIKLSNKFMTLVKTLYEQFPKKKEEEEEDKKNATTSYSAVHVRFHDGMEITNCNTTNVRKLYGKLLARLEQQHVKHGSHILVADSNPAAFRCFQYHGSDRYKAFRIKDYILNNDNSNGSIRKIKEMFENINVQKDTLYLLLDQIMVGLGKEIVFSFHGKTSYSTFQVQIRRWHEHRKAILAALEEPISVGEG